MISSVISLTKEQQDKLAKLESELEKKRTYEISSKARRLAASQRTGIPYDIVDTDVVRIGTMLGLIRNLNMRDSTEKDPDDISILDLLLGMGSSKPTYDYSVLPAYYVLAPERIPEAERVDQHRELVKDRCRNYWSFVTEFLGAEYERVETVVSLSLQQLTPDTFSEAVKESMDAIFEMIIDSDDDEQELYDNLKLLRNSLIGIITVCEYRQILVDQILKLTRKNVSHSVIFNNLSYIDATLSLFPGFDTIPEHNVVGIMRSIVVRSYTKDPILTPLNMPMIKKECCTPALMYVHLAEVLRHTIVGPYSNNSIVYLPSANSFYVLKSIVGEIRMWVYDGHLSLFSRELRKAMHAYVNKILSTIETVTDAQLPIVVQLRDTLAALNNTVAFRKLVCYIIVSASVIVPTDADVFDRITSRI